MERKVSPPQIRLIPVGVKYKGQVEMTHLPPYWSFDPPVDLGKQQGDRMYGALGTVGERNGVPDSLIFVVRDWRASEVSGQIHEHMGHRKGSPYMEQRKVNVRANRGLSHTLRELKGAYAGRSLYVVGSGPSVVGDLRRHPPRDTDVVVGVNKGFSHVGPRADFLLVGDPLINKEMLKQAAPAGSGFMLPGDRARLLMCPWSDPGLVEWFGGEKCFVFRQSGKGWEQEDAGVDMSLPELEYSFNAGSFALHLGDYLGCREIVLVGYDLAYTGGLFHEGEPARRARGIDYHARVDKRGILTVTDGPMMACAAKMETWAWILKQYGVTCVNLTAAGILSRWFEKERMVNHDARA